MGMIMLVRHGQASFGSDNYDLLSGLGQRQARQLGRELSSRDVTPTAMVTGGLQRQRHTAQIVLDAAAWPLALATDRSWDELDHEVLAPVGVRDSDRYQDQLDQALQAWVDTPRHGTEAFADFDTRVSSALHRLADELGRGESAVVVTSAGVISWLAAVLLGGGHDQWIRMNRVCVNSGVTTIVSGRRGLTLVSFNEHSHLRRAETTYR